MTHHQELYKKHRPVSFTRLYGQEAAVESLSKMVEDEKVPHCILLSGPSGCGKTTAARILTKELGCNGLDFVEINCSNRSGIDTVRQIESRVSAAPMNGKSRVWYLDECHRLTSDAQSSMLKMLEDTPPTTYFILATTNPEKLSRAIQTRCTKIQLGSLDEEAISDLLKYVCRKEKIEVSNRVKEKISEAANGSAREALVYLEQVMGMEDEESQIAIVQHPSAEQESIQIARALLKHAGSGSWGPMAKVLREVKEEPETLRWLVLGYFTSVLLSGKNAENCAAVIEEFRNNFFDSKRAGLVLSCYNVVCPPE